MDPQLILGLTFLALVIGCAARFIQNWRRPAPPAPEPITIPRDWRKLRNRQK